MNQPGTVVIARHWFRPESELSYVIRLLAGGASRCGPVSVLVPGLPGTRTPDGAFDLEGIGDETGFQWPPHLASDQTVLVDELTPAVERMLTHTDPKHVLWIAAPEGHDFPWRQLNLVDAGPKSGGANVDLHIPVNRLAERHRHHGFGFTGYQLVLSDRVEPNSEPPAPAAWVTAAFTDLDVVVVEAATAWAWKGRSLRGSVAVDTRMDLWRLVAHASVCIDISPGPFIGRECIEALRFGTPILVPEDSGPAAVLAHRAGNATFSDAGELVSSVSRLQDPHGHADASSAGRAYAEHQFGDASKFIESMRSLLQTKD